jgi:hypothetical protein
MNALVKRNAMRAVVSVITGIPLTSVVWRGTLAERSVVIGTRAVLYTNSKVTAGVDETRYEAPARLTDPQVATRTGQRKFTWSILIETQQLTAPSDDSTDMMDAIRLKLQSPSILAILNAADLAVSSFAGTSNTEFLSGGRTVSQTTMDVYMLSVDNATDEFIGSGDWIGEVIADGDTVDSPAGVPVSPQPHIDADARDI